MRHRFMLFLPIAAILVASCGQVSHEGVSESASGDSPGQRVSLSQSEFDASVTAENLPLDYCSYDLQTLDMFVGLVWLEMAESWVTLDATTLDLAPAEGFDKLNYLPPTAFTDLGVPSNTPVRGEAPDRLFVRNETAQMLRTAIDDGASQLILGFMGGEATHAVAVDTDGEIMFLGDCAFIQTQDLQAFHEYAAANGVEARPDELLLRLVAGDQVARSAYADWQTPDIVAWEDRSPGLRLLDPEATPQSILDGLNHVSIQFKLPEDWVGRAEVICTRASQGWNECGALTLGSTIELTAYTVPGENLDVVILGSSADIGKPVAVLGAVPAEYLDAYDGKGSITALVNAQSFTEAINRIEGESIIEVAGN